MVNLKQVIKVTKNDIIYGDKSNGYGCAVAQALYHTFSLDVDFYVSTQHITMKKDGKEFVFNLPKKVTTFIREFDNDYMVLPFQFTMEVPTWVKPLDKITKVAIQKNQPARLVNTLVPVFA